MAGFCDRDSGWRGRERRRQREKTQRLGPGAAGSRHRRPFGCDQIPRRRPARDHRQPCHRDRVRALRLRQHQQFVAGQAEGDRRTDRPRLSECQGEVRSDLCQPDAGRHTDRLDGAAARREVRGHVNPTPGSAPLSGHRRARSSPRGTRTRTSDRWCGSSEWMRSTVWSRCRDRRR